MITLDEYIDYIKNGKPPLGSTIDTYIKVINCSSELYWYKNEIGRRYRVIRLCKYGYVVQLYIKNRGLYINFNDAEIIMPTFDEVMENYYKMNYPDPMEEHYKQLRESRYRFNL